MVCNLPIKFQKNTDCLPTFIEVVKENSTGYAKAAETIGNYYSRGKAYRDNEITMNLLKDLCEKTQNQAPWNILRAPPLNNAPPLVHHMILKILIENDNLKLTLKNREYFVEAAKYLIDQLSKFNKKFRQFS
jgi:hypothetical protein